MAAAGTQGISPQAAIERAVGDRIGPDAVVTVTAFATAVAPTPGLEAVPDPGGRTGVPVRFQLVARGRRVGSAIATVRVEAPHARALRAISRDDALADNTWELVSGELKDLPFRHLPAAQEIPTLKARRDIAAGEVLTDAALIVPPLVRSGDTVAVTVHVGTVEATGTAVASGSGHLGETIRIMQRSSRRLLNARISGPAAVELIP